MGEVPHVGGYSDLTVIGQGGFATVYRATQVGSGRPVALKVIDRVDASGRSINLFVRECHVLGRLAGHPHIVHVHDVGVTDDGTPYLVMELSEGGTVDDALTHGPFDAAQAQRLGYEVADALGAAHDLGVLHRDIKPANVLVDLDGGHRLTDFGIARIMGGASTTEGATTGTIAYMAPEVLSGQSASTDSDIYALGILLVVAVSGSHPFISDSTDSPYAVIRRVIDEPLPDLPPWTAPALASVIASCCAKDPALRPRSAHEVRDRLAPPLRTVPPDRWQQGPTLVHSPPGPPDQPELGEGTPRSIRPRAAGVALLVLLALTAALVAILSTRDEVVDTIAPLSDEISEPDETDVPDGPDEGSATGRAVETVTAGTLTVCTFPAVPPFSSISAASGSEPVGFDIDLVRAIADRMGLDLAVLDVDAPVEVLLEDTCDLAAAAFTITAAREEVFDFTDGYLDVPLALLVADGSAITSTGDLDGRSIGVVGGTTGEAYAADALGRPDTTPFGTPEELVQAVADEEVAAAIQDLPLNEHFASEIGGVKVVATIPTGDQLGFIVADGARDAVDALDAALAQVREDGTYDTLIDRYFG